jgi:hypothetical protein
MKHTIRKGLGKGKGMGYKDILPGHDKRVHTESGHGMKQPQLKSGMMVISRYTKAKGQVVSDKPFTVKFKLGNKVHTRFTSQYLWKKAHLKDKDKDGVPDVIDCNPRDPAKDKDMPVSEIGTGGDILPPTATPTEDKGPSILSRIASGTVSGAKKIYASGVAAGKSYLAQRAERERIRKEQELEDIKNPVAIAHKKAAERVESLMTKSSNTDDQEELEKINEQLDEAQENLASSEDALENINLSTLTDGELRLLAIRHRDEGLFSTTNKYETELVERVKYRKQLDAKIREAEKKAPEKEEGGLFDF